MYTVPPIGDVREQSDNGVVVAVSELDGGAAATAVLWFRFGEHESEREEESEGASEWKWEAAGSLSLLTQRRADRQAATHDARRLSWSAMTGACPADFEKAIRTTETTLFTNLLSPNPW